MEELQNHDTSWRPEDAEVTLNVTVDAAFVPSAAQGTRLDLAHLVVLDNFISEQHRQQLLDCITAPGWQGEAPPEPTWERATCDGATLPATWGLSDIALKALAESTLEAKLEVQSRLCKLYPDATIAHMPSDRMQPWRVQDEGAPPPAVGCEEEPAAAANIAAVVQLPDVGPEQTAALSAAAPAAAGVGPLPGSTGNGCDHLTPAAGGCCSKAAAAAEPSPLPLTSPCDTPMAEPAPISEPQASAVMQGASEPGCSQADPRAGPKVYASPYVANAAVHGDQFQWHVDADPSDLPDSSWTEEHGRYFNREPGKPLFFSLLLYLDATWPRDHDAETLILDSPSDTGILVRPKPCRAVLMDQDIVHRLSIPSRLAGRPRYSLVWKLVMLPRTPDQVCSIARPEWGAPAAFGSAAKAEALVRQMARKRRLEQQAKAAEEDRARRQPLGQ